MLPLRDTQASYSRPVMTMAIIIVNVMVFIYQLTLDDFSQNHFIAVYGMIPARFQLVDLFTSMWLHGGWMHLIGNMWFLWVFGDNTEDALGRFNYLLFYVLCGLAAGLVHLMFNADSRIPVVGASGAIAGVMGAYLVKFPKARVLTVIFIFVFFTTMELPAWLILVYWFCIQIFSGVGSVGYSHLSQGGVAWFAHVGGFIVGMLLIKLLPNRDRYFKDPGYRW